MSSLPAEAPIEIVELHDGHLENVVRIDAEITGERKEAYWRGVFQRFVGAGNAAGVGLAAEENGALVGYLFGEVRAFEFGSEPCGWVFAIGVDPRHLRARVATTLLRAACRRFAAAGVHRVRTMVRRFDVDLMAFFRARGFVGGSFVQLELDLDEEEA